MADNNGSATLVGAAILGLCILGSGFILGQSVDGASEQLAGVQAAIAKAGTGALAAAGPAGAEAEPQRRRGPDPAKVYDVKTDGSPALGPESAKVTIAEFSDFQCPYCARVGSTLAQVKKEYGDDVRLVFKHLPLSFHSKAPAAHAAAEAAHAQGKFWELHDKIFQNQRAMSEENYLTWAEELGLDMQKFEKDLKSAAVKKRIDADTAEAASLGVTGTPGFFINGKFMSGAKPFASFKQAIDQELGRS